MRPSNLSRLVLSLSIAAALGLPMTACTKSPAPEAAATAAKPAASVEKVVDEHSYAEPDKVRTTDLALDLKVDFASKTISGTATYALE
ncbi:MAG: aminopeptidase, partial [Thermomonas sp.]